MYNEGSPRAYSAWFPRIHGAISNFVSDPPEAETDNPKKSYARWTIEEEQAIVAAKTADEAQTFMIISRPVTEEMFDDQSAKDATNEVDMPAAHRTRSKAKISETVLSKAGAIGIATAKAAVAGRKKTIAQRKKKQSTLSNPDAETGKDQPLTSSDWEKVLPEDQTGETESSLLQENNQVEHLRGEGKFSDDIPHRPKKIQKLNLSEVTAHLFSCLDEETEVDRELDDLSKALSRPVPASINPFVQKDMGQSSKTSDVDVVPNPDTQI